MCVMSACVYVYIVCVCISVHKCMCVSMCIRVQHVHVSMPTCTCVYMCLSVHVLCCASYLTLCGLLPTRLLCPWDSPDKNTGVGCMPSSRGSSQPRDGTQISRTQVSHIAGKFFTV